MIKRPLCLAAVLLIALQAVLVGGFRMAKDLRPSPLELAVEDGGVITLVGTVSHREEKPTYQIYYLTDNQIRLEDQIIKESKILVYIKHEESQTTQNKETQKDQEKQSYMENQDESNIAVGNTLYLTGKVRFFQEAANPGNFDQKFYYQKQGIHACVWAESAEVIEPEVRHLREGLTVFRCRWKELLISCLGEYYGNSMAAILLGDKSELDGELKELYQKSGIGHILAISGLHMSFIGTGFYKLLRKSGLPFWAAGTAGSIFLLLYTLMIGLGVSSLRALVMFLVRIGADMSGRTYDMPTSLSAAAAVIVIWQPLYLMDAGFLLSFGAILGVALVYPVLDGLHVVPKLFCAGLSIHLMLLPVMLYYYFEFPLYSLLLNILVIPLMSVVLGVGIAGSALAFLWTWGGGGILQICKGILWGYEKACGVSMELPFARVVTGQPGKVWMGFYYVLLFSGCILGMKYIKYCSHNKEKNSSRKIRQRHIHAGDQRSGKAQKGDHLYLPEQYITSLVRLALFFLAVSFCIICFRSHGKQGELKVTMIDVGQGDGLYIRTPSGRHYLVDGGSTDVSKAGKYRIEPFLKSQGVRTVDYVFISHGDADHMNGVQELLENQLLGIRIKTLVLPTEQVLDEALMALAEEAAGYGTKVVAIHEGEQISDGGMRLTCLAPAADYSGEIGNASSMVLSLEFKEFDMLFTGDVEGTGEIALAESELLERCDILKVAHHGSKNSTIDIFLEKAVPKIGLISAGRNNRYGHPHQETLERLENLGCRIYSTQDYGAVTVKTDGNEIQILGYLSRTSALQFHE